LIFFLVEVVSVESIGIDATIVWNRLAFSGRVNPDPVSIISEGTGGSK